MRRAIRQVVNWIPFVAVVGTTLIVLVMQRNIADATERIRPPPNPTMRIEEMEEPSATYQNESWWHKKPGGKKVEVVVRTCWPDPNYPNETEEEAVERHDAEVEKWLKLRPDNCPEGG